MLLVPAMVMAEAGRYLWAGLLALALPAVRIATRFRGGRGYYLLGYNDGPGGDFNRSARWINRQQHPELFRLLVVIEVVIVGLLALGILARPAG